MPQMDGFELMKTLRTLEHHQNTPIIVSSASVASLDRTKSIAAGGDEFLAKPVQAGELFHFLKTLLNLNWLYQATDSPSSSTEQDKSDIVPPSADVIESLYELTLCGNLKKVEITVKKLRDDDSIYHAFSEQVILFTQNFKEQDLQKFLQGYRRSLQINE